MRISDFFRSRLSTPRLSHPVFGPCRFFRGREPASSYWEAQVVVPGFDEPLDLAINAAESGPTEEHVQFFQRFASSPEHFVSLAWPELASAFQSWCDRPLPTQWRSELLLVGLELPSDGLVSRDWSISFEIRSDPDHQITVNMAGGAPVSSSVDG
jgi:hypothetical protein